MSVGNVHVKVDGTQDLDLGRLAEIHRQVKLPLVLHGGTGISACSLRQAISLGVAKVNYGTYLKQSYLRGVRGALDGEGLDPHRVLGMGGADDLLVAGRFGVRDAVLERIDLLGCCGRADCVGRFLRPRSRRGARRQPSYDLRTQAALRVEGGPDRARRGGRDLRRARGRLHRSPRSRSRPP